MSWFLTLIFLLFVISHYHPCDARSTRNMKFPSALVVGTVYCDTCFQNDFSKTSHFISGASVAIECTKPNSKTFRKEVETNKHGQFKVALPLSMSKYVKKMEGCSVKLIRSSDPHCSVASAATSTASSLHLKSRKPGTHIFSAGFFTFKPPTQPSICNQKPCPLTNSEKNFDNSFPPPLQHPPPSSSSSTIPPIDNPGQFQPSPILPRLPPFPKSPNLPDLPKTLFFPPKPTNNDFSNDKSFVFPPNPFQPPLVPNPLQPPPIFPPFFPSPPSTFPPIFPSPPSIFPPIFPSPPPSIFPPIFPWPSPPTLFPPIPLFPPVPFLTPPPSPPRPAFPLIPPFPFQPVPGVPPAVSLAGSKGDGP